VKNWKAIALAHAPDVPAPAVDRITAPLDALEAAFRPLVKSLGPEAEPATTFRPDEFGEASGERS